jgi:CheY-like chemotaxis protein
MFKTCGGNRGLAVWMSLADERCQSGAGTMTSDASLSGLRVLVVEDEALIAMLLEDYLGEFGCTIVGPASNLAEGRRLIEGGGIDVALLDLNLGRGEKSYDLAVELATRSVPFAFVFGADSQSLQDPFRIRPVLQKPFGLADLERTLTQLATATGVDS